MTTIIKRVKTTSVEGKSWYVADVNFLGQDKELWFNINAELLPHEQCSLADAALVALLIPSMYHNEDILCEPLVSCLLSQSLSLRIQRLLCLGNPTLTNIDITLRSVNNSQDGISRSGRNGLSFSGGVDACTSFLDYYLSPPPQSNFRIGTLLFNNVGNQDFLDEQSLALSLARCTRFHNKLKHLDNLDLYLVDSNLPLFYALPGETGSFDGKLAHGLNHSVRNISVGLFLQNFLDSYLYSSGVDYKNLSIIQSDPAYVDPLILPMFNTEHISFIPVGSEYTRVDKTRKVLNHKLTSKILDVCLRPPGRYVNCGKCMKCKRTLACAEALNMLEVVYEIFDIDAYQKESKAYWNQIADESSNIFSFELKKLAIETGLKPPQFFESPRRNDRFSQFARLLISPKRTVKHGMRKVYSFLRRHLFIRQ